MRWCYLLCLLLLPLTGAAQSTGLSAAQVPLSARHAADFVPLGWRIEARIGGDLNADQRPDSVLMLLEARERLNENSRPSRKRALLVLLAEPNRTWRRVGYTEQLLYCTGCFIRQTSQEESTPVVELSRRGVLSVHVGDGTSNIWTFTAAHFRFDAGSGRLRLIGEDVEHKNGTYSEQQISTNLLTHRQKLTTTLLWTAAGDSESKPRVTTRWRPLKPLKCYLEDYRVGRTLRHDLE